MINFYPGPSKIYEKVGLFVNEGLKEGILSRNHRSSQFMSLVEETSSLLKDHLNAPDDYQILYTSSATECWEIIAQSVIEKSSLHYFNGAFGEKWFEYTRKLGVRAEAITFEIDEVPALSDSIADVICFTHNETSNGTMIPHSQLHGIRSRYRGRIICMDATSSLAGMNIDLAQADIWFASIQKCFGLPAGLGVMICSPQVVNVVKDRGERSHYNSLAFMIENAEKNQTHYTPNILAIYLLNRLLKEIPNTSLIERETMRKHHWWQEFVKSHHALNFLITNDLVRSTTVQTLSHTNIKGLLMAAEDAGFIIGKGYGEWKSDTFRIANFPAIEDNDIEALQKFLANYLN